MKPYTIEVQRLKSIRHDHHGLIEVSLDALVSARQAARDDSEPGVPSSCLSIPVEHARTLVLRGDALGEQAEQQHAVLVRHRLEEVAGLARAAHQDVELGRVLRAVPQLGLDVGVVEKKGAWLQFDGALIGQGKDAAKKALVEKPDLAKKIVEAILVKRNSTASTSAGK